MHETVNSIKPGEFRLTTARRTAPIGAHTTGLVKNTGTPIKSPVAAAGHTTYLGWPRHGGLGPIGRMPPKPLDANPGCEPRKIIPMIALSTALRMAIGSATKY